ncbi:MAG TPA: hypothetical protein VM864_06505 [Pyrinomonadaceae bacterium]|jgi:hypothetical protein|nr:hypothetical protein [Pyrinomonadaceae bacterium]
MTKQDSQTGDYKLLKERLRSGALTAEDKQRLEEIISLLEGGKADASLGTVGGRPIIARLPGGLDVVK